jgi:glycosyltransferase involved in cell wall biosynthesis
MPEPAPPRRLLFALPFLHYGVGRLAVDLAAAAVARGWAVDVVTCGGQSGMDDEGTLLAEVRDLGGEIHQADLFSRDAATMHESAGRVGHICRRRSIAGVHAYTAPAAAAALPHCPVMASVVGWSPHKLPWQRSDDVRVLDRCAIVTAVSDAVVTELREAGLQRPDLCLIRNGVALEPTRDLSAAAAPRPLGVIGAMAHFIDRKGLDVLIEAVARLPLPAWTNLILAGHGEAEASLRALANERLPDDRVTWTGVIPTSAFFGMVDVVVVPSRSDALPLVLLQAMAYGRPVIASAVGGIPEAVTHPTEALLVEADDAGALARAIEVTLLDPGGALERARAGRRRIERDFSLPAVVDRYLECYAALCR